MSAIDDLRALAQTLPGDVKPVAAEVVDVVAAIAHTLDAAGVKVPAPVDEAVAVAEQATDDETVGSAVFDAAGAGSEPAAQPDPPPTPSPAPPSGDVDVKALQDEIQALQIQLADAQKTQHTAEPQ